MIKATQTVSYKIFKQSLIFLPFGQPGFLHLNENLVYGTGLSHLLL